VKKAHPIGNLGKYAHAPKHIKTNVNFPKPPTVQVENRSPKLGKMHTGKKRHA
jgi:hypothetical protein